MLQPTFRTQLEIAILWLEGLIDNKEKREACYQEFFEQNPIVFTVLGYDNYYSFTKDSGRDLPRDEQTNLKPEPDFIVERDNGLYEIFEIKTPFSKKLMINSNKYRERFTAEVSNYISQTITYEKYFTRNPANRRKVNEFHGLDIQEDLDIKIVIGLNEQVDKVKVHQKSREFNYKVDIVTYDDILSRLINEYDRLYSEYEDLPGFSFHFMIRFREEQLKRKKYFLDIGHKLDKDRISVFLDEYNNVYFEVIDRVGKKYQVEIDTKEVEILNAWIYLICEFGLAKDGFVMSIAVNGSENDKRVKKTSINQTIPIMEIFLGCDINKQHFGRFDIAEKLIYSHTFAFREKYKIQEYFVRKYSEDSAINTYSEFDGHRFMCRDEFGDFVQEKEEFCPLFRNIAG